MKNIREGEFYKTLIVCDKAFDILYGYYCESERDRWEPTPIYPDFIKNPQHTKDGRPFATAEQAVCEHYTPKANASGEEWCNDCVHFKLYEEIIGVCQCRHRQKSERKDE
ncbi:MAG: hypothetical protein Q4B40_00125 [Clostridia bacterium]|nr:hypothetical protein [Clostridia bacterium]